MRSQRLINYKSFLLTNLLIAFITSACSHGTSHTWQSLAPGLFYRKVFINTPQGQGNVHAFRFNLTHYQFRLAFAEDLNQTMLSAREAANQFKALIAINGGFFTPNYASLGLRINNGRQYSPLKKTSWWGIFYVKDNKAFITTPKNYKSRDDIHFAVQSGPRLISEGKIVKLKGGLDRRSALGITQEGEVIIVVTDQIPLSTQQLAELMIKPEQKDGLNCRDALNLDGGSSTQLYAQVGNFNLNIPSFLGVADVVLIVPHS